MRETSDPILVTEPADAPKRRVVAYRCPVGCRFNAYMYGACPEHGAGPVAQIVVIEVEEGLP